MIATMRPDLAGRGSQEPENPALGRYLEAFERWRRAQLRRLREGRSRQARDSALRSSSCVAGWHKH